MTLFGQESVNSVALLRSEALQILQMESGSQDIIRLVQLDLGLSDEPDAESRMTCRNILRALAMSENITASEHVRSVFENEPERRAAAAWALSQATSLRPTDLQDWRYMVRSLTVVKGEDAVSVMNALQRFRPRANKPQWIRRVILVGLQLEPEWQTAATDLLRHWTGVPRKSNAAAAWTLADYQSWFAKEHPEHPEAVLPVEKEGRKWTVATTRQAIQDLSSSPELVEAGKAVYSKAGCQKCHRRGKLGESFGPDLTTLGWRRQREEILQALLFPSHELDEEYPTVSVELKDGRTLSGILSAGSQDTLSLISSTGMRDEFPRADMVQIVNQKISNMPEGTLEPLNAEEIQALFSLLTSIDGIPKPHGDELE
jgi:putative heme-binding domain-containing protein